MKIEIKFKTPDAVYYAIEDLIDSTESACEDTGFVEYVENIKKDLDQWILYGELVTLVFDTETKELTVKRK